MAFSRTNDAIIEARTRAFSAALHEQLGSRDEMEDRYRYLLALTTLLGGNASMTDAQHADAITAIAQAQAIADRTNPRRRSKVRGRS